MARTDLWKFVEAEALDAAHLPDGCRLDKAVLVTEVSDPSGKASKLLRINYHEAGRALRSTEEAGLLAKALTDALDQDRT